MILKSRKLELCINKKMRINSKYEKNWRSLSSLPLMLSSRVMLKSMDLIFFYLLFSPLYIKNINSKWIVIYQFYLWIKRNDILTTIFNNFGDNSLSYSHSTFILSLPFSLSIVIVQLKGRKKVVIQSCSKLIVKISFLLN